MPADNKDLLSFPFNVDVCCGNLSFFSFRIFVGRATKITDLPTRPQCIYNTTYALESPFGFPGFNSQDNVIEEHEETQRAMHFKRNVARS